MFPKHLPVDRVVNFEAHSFGDRTPSLILPLFSYKCTFLILATYEEFVLTHIEPYFL